MGIIRAAAIAVRNERGRSGRLLHAALASLTAMSAGVGLALATANPAAAWTLVNCSSGTSLQTAIDNASPGAKMDITGTCVGNFTISKDLIMRGIDGGATLNGNNDGKATLIIPREVTVSLSAFVITNGLGGGLLNSGTLTLDKSIIRGNGGLTAIYGGIANARGEVTLNNSTVASNTNGSSGGGIYNYFGKFTLNNSTVANNSAFMTGGGIYNDQGTFTLSNSTIRGNRANGSGGGIYNGRATFTLDNSTISGNDSTGEDGGGIYNASGTLTLDAATVTSNTVAKGGGGIMTAGGSAAVTLQRSAVSGNSAKLTGGGIYAVGGKVTLSGSRVTSNRSYGQPGSGGGIYVNPYGASVVLLSGTAVTDNTPDNCAPPGSVQGCTAGPARVIPGRPGH